MLRRSTALTLVVLLCAALRLSTASAQDDGGAAVLKRIDVDQGICALLGDRGCGLALDLARKSRLTIYVQLPGADEVRAACGAAEAAGFLGSRVFIEKGTPARIGLANDLADTVVLLGDSTGVNKAEVLRVLRPGAKAVAGSEEWVKPVPEGMDDWSHHYCRPDNNPQSRDRLARAPYLTQFVAEPRYATAPQAAVASGGRLFMAFGHVAWHQREEPAMNTLMAVNGYNGTLLWKRPLTPGIMVDRSTMIATPGTLYLADEKSCKLLDAATGKLRDEIAVPADLTDGTFWKWMALDDGLLLALIGPEEKQDPSARWRSVRHGWPWTGISQGYNEPKYAWGFAKTLVAIDPKTKKVVWSHREDPPIDSRSLCTAAGRVYFCSFGEYVGCLDSKTGRTLWKRTAEKDREIFQAIGPYRPGHGYVGGWKSTAYLKCTDKALYFVGPQVEWLTALSAADGRVLWRHPAKDLHIILRDDALYTIGPQNSPGDTKKLDALTGKILENYDTRRRACTRATGTCDGIFFRAHEGSGRFDLAAGKTAWFSAVRPSCHVGVVAANGHLYWLPWACDCNLQMFGVFACGPAGEFAFDQKATEADRLEKGTSSASVAAGTLSPNDWPTYRADVARSARSRAKVAERAQLLWRFDAQVRTYPTAPVAAGGLVYVGGADGIVRALDAASGQERWKAYTGGSVRFPPTIANGLALVGSDDGWAYAWDAATGRPVWRFRAAPVERKLRVYDKLLSTWPVASGVLVGEGKAYLAAGMNDFDGTHVYCLDAATGKILWQNNSTGHLDAFSKRGIACQGELLLDGGKLYLAGGNSVSPGVFDAATGACLNSPPGGMGTSAPRGRELHLVGGQVRVSGQPLHSLSAFPVYDRSTQWARAVVTAANAKLELVESRGEKGPAWSLVARSLDDTRQLWSHTLAAEPVRYGLAVDARGRVLVALGNGQVQAFGAPRQFVMPFTAANTDDAVHWQQTARAKLLELVEKQEPRRSTQALPIDFQTGQAQDKREYTLYPASFQSNGRAGTRHAALLAVPKGKGPFPAMLALHGHGGSAQAVFDPKSIYHGFADRLARGAYVVLAPSLPHRPFAAMTLWDLFRAVDILRARPEVDPERIGVAGLSMGGEWTMWIAACDPRLKVAVVSGWMCTTEGVFSVPNCKCWELPGFVELMDVCEVHLLIAPRPVLFESAERDGCFPIRYTREGFARIHAGYKVFGAESAVQQDVWPAGHEWHGVMAYPLIDKVLGGHAAK